MGFVSCVSHAFASVHCCLVVTCCIRADLLALVGEFYCILVTFPIGILGQVCNLIASYPDLCRIFYFVRTTSYLKAIMEVYGKTITGLGPCSNRSKL